MNAAACLKTTAQLPLFSCELGLDGNLGEKHWNICQKSSGVSVGTQFRAIPLITPFHVEQTLYRVCIFLKYDAHRWVPGILTSGGDRSYSVVSGRILMNIKEAMEVTTVELVVE